MENTLENRERASLNIARTLLDTSIKIDNWDPCTCPIDDLRDHLTKIEQIEGFVKVIGGRADFLRGVLSARVLSEIMHFDQRNG